MLATIAVTFSEQSLYIFLDGHTVLEVKFLSAAFCSLDFLKVHLCVYGHFLLLPKPLL